jgi:hypothetical protein
VEPQQSVRGRRAAAVQLSRSVVAIKRLSRCSPSRPTPPALEAAYRATVYTPGANHLSVETVERPSVDQCPHPGLTTPDFDAFYAAVEAQLPAIRGRAGLSSSICAAQTARR